MINGGELWRDVAAALVVTIFVFILGPVLLLTLEFINGLLNAVVAVVLVVAVVVLDGD